MQPSTTALLYQVLATLNDGVPVRPNSPTHDALKRLFDQHGEAIALEHYTAMEKLARAAA